MSMDLPTLIQTMVERNASDLHLTVGAPPAFRIDGQMVRAKTAPLSFDDVKKFCLSILTEKQRKTFEQTRELDFAIGIKNIARVRVNLFIQRGAVAGVFRRIPSQIPSLFTLGFNDHVTALAERPHGLVLVTGPTGSGKSTTIAAYLNQINKSKRYHIVTIEDPIEYTHTHQMSIVNQREVGSDCESFSTALRQVLREDPDVILVGEMRDRETAEAALKAAETGHLVFSTLHTNGAIASINRIIQLFPIDSQDYVRSMLSFTIQGVLTQALVQRKDLKGRALCYEYMAATPGIRNLIREGKLHQVYGQMQIGGDGYGMVTMNANLLNLIRQDVITADEAFEYSPDPEELAKELSRMKGNLRKAA